jgi:hypothetical protein
VCKTALALAAQRKTPAQARASEHFQGRMRSHSSR